MALHPNFDCESLLLRMSARVSAIMSHRWETFSQKTVREMACSIFGESADISWVNSSFTTPEDEFATDGTVRLSLPTGFSLYFGKKIICLLHTDRWYRFLTNQESHGTFLETSTWMAKLTGSEEIIIGHDDDRLMDLYYDDKGYEDFKQGAIRIWGPPDLEMNHIYSEEEMDRMPKNRGHYGVVKITN